MQGRESLFLTVSQNLFKFPICLKCLSALLRLQKLDLDYLRLICFLAHTFKSKEAFLWSGITSTCIILFIRLSWMKSYLNSDIFLESLQFWFKNGSDIILNAVLGKLVQWLIFSIYFQIRIFEFTVN